MEIALPIAFLGPSGSGKTAIIRSALTSSA